MKLRSLLLTLPIWSVLEIMRQTGLTQRMIEILPAADYIFPIDHIFKARTLEENAIYHIYTGIRCPGYHLSSHGRDLIHLFLSFFLFHAGMVLIMGVYISS